MCTVLRPPGVNVYCTTATGCQCVLYYYHRVAMCTVLLPPGVNVYCTTITITTGCQCVLYYCHRVSTQFQLTNISKGRVMAQVFSQGFKPAPVLWDKSSVEWISLRESRVPLHINSPRLHTDCESTECMASLLYRLGRYGARTVR
jgi:hypothetical protein